MEIDPAGGMHPASCASPRWSRRRAFSGPHRWLPLIFFLQAAGCGGEDREPPPPEGTEVGQTAPALEGVLSSGEEFELASGRRERTVLLFYRGERCGLCRRRLEEAREHLDAYRALGARLIAVTLDPPSVSERTAERLGGEVPIVSVDSGAFARWGMLDTLQRAPLPGAYLLDDRRVILFRHLGVNAGDRSSDAALLTILETTDR